MKLDEFRMEILAQHHSIRALLVNVEELAQRVTEGDAVHEKPLRRAARQFVHELLRHMADEERLLREMLREGYVLAGEQLAEFQHNHAHQRGLIASFNLCIERVASPRRLGAIVEAVTEEVALEMGHEEVALLGMLLVTQSRGEGPRVAVT
jgi:iron-sulfur cluster repair protein YtfE (RIC family)